MPLQSVPDSDFSVTVTPDSLFLAPSARRSPRSPEASPDRASLRVVTTDDLKLSWTGSLYECGNGQCRWWRAFRLKLAHQVSSPWFLLVDTVHFPFDHSLASRSVWDQF